MKMNLLELVQRILESMDSDEVTTYSETVESTAVANIVKESYFHIVRHLDLPVNHTFFQLTASGDSTKPCLMTMPSDAFDLDYIQYSSLDASNNTVYDYVEYLTLEEFIKRTFSLRESDTDVSTMTVALDGTNFTFKFKTNEKPTFFTVVDDNNIIFNAYDSSVETTLVSSKTLCYGKKIPVFTMSDTFVPQMEADQFDYLLNEAKSQAHAELKQSDNAFARRRAKQGFINTQRTKRNIPVQTSQRRPNFGRKTIQ